MPTHECPLFLGVDVAKLTLAIQFTDQLWSTANTAQGHAAFLARLRALGPVHVICEATGGYERALALALHQAGIAVSRASSSSLLVIRGDRAQLARVGHEHAVAARLAQAAHPRRVRARLHYDHRGGKPRGERFQALAGVDDYFRGDDVTAGTEDAHHELRMTVTVRPHGATQLLVRANAKFADPRRNVAALAIEDPAPYRDFFAALAKSLFLEAQEAG